MLNREDWSRDAQIEFGKKICVLIEKNFGANFSTSFQGAGKVAILKVVGSDPKLIGRIRVYLWNNFMLPQQKNGKNHGSGMHSTCLINLSEVKDDSFTKLLDTFKENFNGEGVKKIKQIVVSDESQKTATISIVEVTPKKESTVIKKEKDNNLTAMKVSIFAALKFEGLSSHVFQCELIGGLYQVNCASIESAMVAEQCLVWKTGDRSLVVRSDDSILLVDYSKKITKDISMKKVVFCLPPAQSETIDRVKERLNRVSFGSKPNIQHNDQNPGFVVSYSRSNFIPKIFSALQLMGWNVKEKDKNSFWLYASPQIESETMKESLPNNATPIVEPVVIAIPEDVPVPRTTTDDLDLRISTHKTFHCVSSKDEALAELKRIYEDPELSTNLSEETKNNIFEALEENWRKTHPEEYAKSLLDFLKK